MNVNIPLLYQTVVDNETNEILKQVNSKSAFVSEAILHLAKDKGFSPPQNSSGLYVCQKMADR